MVLLFAVRPTAVVGACQIPAGTGERASPLSHCGVGGGGGAGDVGITASIALFADENGRNEPAETPVTRQQRVGDPELFEPATGEAASPPAAAIAATAEARQDGALRNGRAARRHDDRPRRQRYQSSRSV